MSPFFQGCDFKGILTSHSAISEHIFLNVTIWTFLYKNKTKAGQKNRESVADDFLNFSSFFSFQGCEFKSILSSHPAISQNKKNHDHQRISGHPSYDGRGVPSSAIVQCGGSEQKRNW